MTQQHPTPDASKHTYRTAEGVHIAEDLPLFAGATALAAAYGLPKHDVDDCKLRSMVMNSTTLRVEFHGYSLTTGQQALTFKSVVQEAGIGGLTEHQWRIPKEGNGVMVVPSERDYFGHSVDIDLAANGGAQALAAKLQAALEQAKPRGHATRIQTERHESSRPGMLRG